MTIEIPSHLRVAVADAVQTKAERVAQDASFGASGRAANLRQAAELLDLSVAIRRGR